MMRGKLIATFALGFAAGALCLGALLWTNGALRTAEPPVAVLPQPKLSGALPELSMADRVPKPGPAAVPPTFQIPAAPAQAQNSADRMETLLVPVQGAEASRLVDNFNDNRAGHKHEALDIPAPRGTPVRAATEGNVAKLFTSKQGGLTVYQFDDSGTFCYYYAHLDHYAPGLHEGVLLRRGDVLGYVGSTGDASPEAPHLHFAIFRLGPEKKWWQGTAIDPLPLLR